MKKILSMICATVVMTGSAFAGNVENPLYLPSAGEFYSKSGVGLMYKRSDHSEALKTKHLDGNDEFPIWRFTEDLGYGITDRLAVHGRFGWTQDDSINRKGMHRGRVGLTYRILSEEQSPISWDVYSEAYLSALMPMKGSFDFANQSFTYDNYSNGRWGVYAGTKLGKTLGIVTLSMYAEYLQTFGNHNNKIKILQNQLSTMAGIPDEISVDLASTHEVNAGINTFVQLSKKWSVGGGFEFIEHRDNSVTGIHTKLNTPAMGYEEYQQKVVQKLLMDTADMDDGWNEYVLKVSGAYQMTDMIQFAVFAEYTFDTSHPKSQNGTDIKAEAGARVNIAF